MNTKTLAKSIPSKNGVNFQLVEFEPQVYCVVKFKNGVEAESSKHSGDLKKVNAAFAKAIGKAAIEFNHAEMIIEENTVVRHKFFKMGTGSAYRLVGIWSVPDRSMLIHNNALFHKMVSARPKSCQFHCAHCGTSILNHYIIRDDNGEDFAVGSSCIEKLGQTRLISEAKAAKLEIDREKRRVEREKKNKERQEKREAELNSQRERNGGMTDYELKQKEKQERKEDFFDFSRDVAKPILKILKKQNGGFVESIASNYKQGDVPRGGAKPIIIDIVNKDLAGGARKGSKAYNSFTEEAIKLVNDVETAINTEREKLYNH
ncbi:hypothetical protein OTK49_28340 [Vibrio coralliirubri]|uniref:hypothetical protein n=1 Tax=Vibrio coralliirubri TaxID=1516159 RepID=UPI0022849A06|nr:hypothetical protein [Vibrio coralliirubri]MCY9866453.1 hypothetical protein [Vibrio coralliirubri]